MGGRPFYSLAHSAFNNALPGAPGPAEHVVKLASHAVRGVEGAPGSGSSKRKRAVELCNAAATGQRRGRDGAYRAQLGGAEYRRGPQSPGSHRRGTLLRVLRRYRANFRNVQTALQVLHIRSRADRGAPGIHTPLASVLLPGQLVSGTVVAAAAKWRSNTLLDKARSWLWLPPRR